MAGSARSAATKHAYRMFAPTRGGGAATTRGPGAGAAEEFDESDVVWGSHSSNPGAELQSAAAWARPIPAATSRGGAGRKKKQQPAAADGGGGGGAAGSLPMNIPDWQKILGVEYRDHRQRQGEWEPDSDDDGGGRARGGAEMVPPHELAWRGRAASMSVHEGVGRTLKGRDLSRVRDAVWKQTGFED